MTFIHRGTHLRDTKQFPGEEALVDIVGRSGIQDIDALLWGYRWSSTDLTYAFPTSSSEYLAGGYAQIDGFQPLDGGWQSAVTVTLQDIANFSGLTISAGAPGDIATIRLGGAEWLSYTEYPSVARLWGGHYPGGFGTAEGNPPELDYNGNPPTAAPYAQGDVWFYLPNYLSVAPGTYGFAAGIMHEIGHALGLKHGHVLQPAHGDAFPRLTNAHNSFEYSVMTYHQYVGDTTPGDSAQDHPTSYMQSDIAALQYLYGANLDYNSGDTTYSWNPKTEHFPLMGRSRARPGKIIF